MFSVLTLNLAKRVHCRRVKGLRPETNRYHITLILLPYKYNLRRTL